MREYAQCHSVRIGCAYFERNLSRVMVKCDSVRLSHARERFFNVKKKITDARHTEITEKLHNGKMQCL
uniref:Uncharacterized protein n=1 Tax=Parascaris equorum TaxID=6256 RepID=A0A914S1T5_PAREQ